jgi:hypothetical protein
MQTEIRENEATEESWSVIHPLTPQDSVAMTALRSAVVAMKGRLEGVAARGPFNGIMERGAAPDAVSFEADIRDVQHCRTREGSVGLFYLARKRGTAAITGEFDLHKLDRDKLLLYAQKKSATCKVRTARVVGSNWCRSFEREVVMKVVEFCAGAFL